ncbi:aminotransferase class III-fold pyridoxal phosphate-dependent enzyme [Streptomyces mexicanus]|uniref:aminotransferase class III-fold pyridoxal phosphate-dependent enzyme n=1 Tax=Streptomyces mexicanus TaxID=178566 RepID=UPI0022A82035|nr:aminotransferase class III-fold pyridoxal phosphate-dependent enzyme [Streptomyces mexicanus]
MSAVMVGQRVMDTIAEGSKSIGAFGHGFTYSGHPVAAAVAREALAVLVDEDIPRHVRDTAPRLMECLDVFRGAEAVRDVRGYGFAAVTFTAGVGGRKEGDMSAAVMAKAVDNGLLLRAIGDTVAFAPPLVTTAEEITVMADLFEKSYRSVLAEPRGVSR